MTTARDQNKAKFANKFGASIAANPVRGAADPSSQAAAEAAKLTVNDPEREAARFKDQDEKAREIIRDQASPSLRRADFKGNRKQAAFRLREDIMRRVRLVLELRSGEGNDFFEAALNAAAEAELARLKPVTNPAVWDDAAARVEAKLKR